jgi:predicted nucleic acid-binding protein
VILVDTGPLVAIANNDEQHHEACKQLLETAPGPLLVPSTVVAEACYLIQQASVGTKAEAQFLRLFAQGVLELAELLPDDLNRMADLVEQYGDWPLGGTDASLVAFAERLRGTDIATLDHRHFGPIRPRHVEAFTLYPRL